MTSPRPRDRHYRTFLLPGLGLPSLLCRPRILSRLGHAPPLPLVCLLAFFFFSSFFFCLLSCVYRFGCHILCLSLLKPRPNKPLLHTHDGLARLPIHPSHTVPSHHTISSFHFTVAAPVLYISLACLFSCVPDVQYTFPPRLGLLFFCSSLPLFASWSRNFR